MMRQYLHFYHLSIYLSIYLPIQLGSYPASYISFRSITIVICSFCLALYHVQQLGDLGLLGITCDEKYGGSGMDAVAAVITHEELSSSDPGLLCFGVSRASVVCLAF